MIVANRLNTSIVSDNNWPASLNFNVTRAAELWIQRGGRGRSNYGLVIKVFAITELMEFVSFDATRVLVGPDCTDGQMGEFAKKKSTKQKKR